ncbi:50S ribosomal protein L39e [Candidatus Micrarchaeota archaeon]|nr:50S ribosomal protein L39e [Candidatus Micrarchaeota archaeon]
MSSKKSHGKKKHLRAAFRKNKRGPVWLALRTRNRSLVRGRTRNWRQQKLTKHIKRKMKND